MISVPIKVRHLLEKDTCRKNFRVRFVDGEHADLINENIDMETVSLTESICSGDIRFGMCESSILSFDCDLSRNLKGSEIVAQIEVDISNESDDFIDEYGQTSDDVDFVFYPVFYGDFIIKDCKKSKNGLRHVVAYTQLLGEDKVTSNGTISFADYGLSDFELHKMEHETRGSDYKFNLKAFIMSSTDYEIDLDNMTEVAFDQDVEESRTRIILVYDNGSESEFYEYYSFYVYGDLVKTESLSNLSSNLFYVDGCYDEQYAFINGIISEYTDGKCKSKRDWFGSIKSNLNNSHSGMVDKIKNGYFHPYLSSTSSEESAMKWVMERINIRYVEVRNALTGDILDIPYNGRNAKMYKYDASLISNEPIMSFPKTLSSKVGSTNYYRLDYTNLFSDGVEVTKKDKKGNSVTKRYSFSFRDVVESYAELNAMFGMYWRRIKSFSFENLLFPDKSKTVGVVTVGSALGVGTKSLVSECNIMELYYDDELTKPYGKVVCTCSPSDSSTEVFLEYNIIDLSGMNENDYSVYDLSGNYFISTYNPKTEEILNYMMIIADALRGVRYMPCDLVLKGIPFVEAGDWIEFETKDGTMITNVLRQTISGVQHLITSIESGV